MSTPTGSPTLPPQQPPSPPSQPFSSVGVPTPMSLTASMPAAFPTTSRPGLGLSERPVRRFSNPSSRLRDSELPLYQPSPVSEGGSRAAAKARERQFFHARDALNMSPSPSLPDDDPPPRNSSPVSLVDYMHGSSSGMVGNRPYRRVVSFNAKHFQSDNHVPSGKARRRTMHEIFGVDQREQMDKALHFDVCDELDRANSSLDLPILGGASDSPSDSGTRDEHDEGTVSISRPPSPPPSSPTRQEFRHVREEYDQDPAYHHAQLDSEISMLRAHVESLSHQLSAVSTMCYNLHATRALPPMIPYCTAPHVTPGTPFSSTVHCTQCDSQMRLQLVSQSVDAPYELGLVQSTPL
ncbi:hypothetical protein PENSPDRAFT_749906 [Peniophora sp. CONT]|nr:hypothetical protein PENSPDRAFT_749906 [Peniophora sp. CONT]